MTKRLKPGERVIVTRGGPESKQYYTTVSVGPKLTGLEVHQQIPAEEDDPVVPIEVANQLKREAKLEQKVRDGVGTFITRTAAALARKEAE